MKEFTREELLDLAAAYALGAASPDEKAAIEAALPGMPELATEIAAYSDVTVKLAEQQSMQPSPSVRAEFLSRIGDSKGAALPITPRAATPSKWPIAILSLGLAASLLVAVQLGRQNSRLKIDLSERDRVVASAKAEAEKRHHQLNVILEGEKDLRVVQLKSADTVNGPGVQVFLNEKQHLAMGHAFRLKPAPAGRAYQVWFIVKGKPVGVSVFNSDPDGHAIFEDFTLPASIEGVTDVLVTEEPAGGSPQPTSTPFIGGKMPAL